MTYLYYPFILQGLLMAVDENIHIKRGLGRWESLGHPLDTLTVLIPMIFVALYPVSEERLFIFAGMGFFSSFFITKDEFIHSRECSGFENWLHAALFVLHPIIFVATGMLWKFYSDDLFLKIQPLVIASFMFYQILRWSLPWLKHTK